MKRLAGLWSLLLALGLCGALGAQPISSQTDNLSNKDVAHWLTRLQDSTRQLAYIGTFVVNAGNLMSTSRIWHVCDGQQQIERVDTLSGARQTTFRHNDEVVTFLPDSHIAIQETRESMGEFPHLLQRSDTAVSYFYRMKSLGHARVAGLQADVVQLTPVDTLRFGYRVWTDQQTGLVVKLQTLDPANKVLEQAAFSELQLNAPLAVANLKRMMDNTQGYQVHSPKMRKTTVTQEGWKLDVPVPGFVPVRCYKPADGDAVAALHSLQCVYSDGLASVSLFIEPYDPKRHLRVPAHEALSMGATHMRVRQLDGWWLTAVGEVPASTLTGFLQALERKK